MERITNEQKAKEICMNIVPPYTDFIHQNYKTAIEMAEWKDEQHKKEIVDLKRKLNAEKELRKQIVESVRGLPQPIKELIKAMNMVI